MSYIYTKPKEERPNLFQLHKVSCRSSPLRNKAKRFPKIMSATPIARANIGII